MPQINLSEDEEVHIVSSKSLSPSEAAIERVFRHYHCDVIITDRLRSLFTLKLWRMGKAIHGLGGTARSKKCEQWRESKWLLELYSDEIILPSNCKVKHENRVVLQAKKTKLEENLDAANKKFLDLTKRYKTLQKSCKELSNSLANEGVSTAATKKERLETNVHHNIKEKNATGS